MQVIHFLLITLSLMSHSFGIPVKRNWDANAAFTSALNATWSNDPACPNSFFNYASVWDVAVAGKATTNSGDIGKTTQIINTLYKYQNSDGWFTSTPGGNEMYVDDNAQVLWVFLDAYDLTKNQQYLTTAINLMDLIQTQWSEIGGVIWQVGADYVASISTTEAALSAVKLYQYNNDQTLLTFANSCLTWMDEHLTDTDGFYFDGINQKDWAVNCGKLTYTVGVAMSTYAYLYKYTGDLHYVLDAVRKAYGTLTSNVFLRSNGFWNNDLRYVHLLFAGFADLITMCGQSGYIPQVADQALFIYDYDSIGGGNYLDFTSNSETYDRYVADTSDRSIVFQDSNNTYCNGVIGGQLERSLIDNASAAQIFYEISRFYG
ncbi:hypothetical protein SBY92_002416 [Candida maltosa Xu316]